MMDKEYLREIAKLVDARLPDNHGFILLTFPFGADKGRRLTYTANCEREGAIATVKEWLLRVGAAEDWMKHIT